MIEHRARGLITVALRTIRRQVREADIHVLEDIPLQQAAHADGNAVFQFDEPQPESELAVAGERTLADVLARGACRPHVPVADIRDEGRVVEQLQDERRVVLGVHLADHQPRGRQDDSRRRAATHG